MRIVALAVGGILLWVATQFFAASIGGAGHGWTSPFWVTFPLLVIYPLVMIRTFLSRANNTGLGVLLIVTAIVLDVVVFQSSMGEIEYVWKVWDIAFVEVVAWIALWFGWQVLLACSFVRPSR